MVVPQPDGHLPAAVIRANAVVDTCVQAARAVLTHGGDFCFESPVSRGAGSRFAIPGKAEHVGMTTHVALKALASLPG
eukprot:460170-Pleurochrysis_carterae.AAC.1